ncbi:MAG TPA: Flp pilus assembly protein CpaB [Acidobacteriaceae bacterium]|nr:Flp pilus assembly protein CpaB [Acidobacteriaceae bacterium]
MNKRVQIILFSAFVIAALCSYLVYKVVGKRVAASQPKTRTVVIATQDIKLGGVLKESDLGTTQIEGPIPDGAITKPEQAIGRGVVSDLYKGEPILENRLASPGAGGGLAATIPDGMRVCAVRVDDVVAVGGFVTPGMRVDVLISGNPPGGDGPDQGPKVKTLLQNIEVLSAGANIERDGEGKPQSVPVVNLLVTPDQAEQLSLASSQTHIQLVLRNPLDTKVAHTEGTTVGNLYAGATVPPPKVAAKAVVREAPRAAKPAPKVYVIQVYNGSKQSEQKFAAGEEKQ